MFFTLLVNWHLACIRFYLHLEQHLKHILRHFLFAQAIKIIRNKTPATIITKTSVGVRNGLPSLPAHGDFWNNNCIVSCKTSVAVSLLMVFTIQSSTLAKYAHPWSVISKKLLLISGFFGIHLVIFWVWSIIIIITWLPKTSVNSLKKLYYF